MHRQPHSGSGSSEPEGVGGQGGRLPPSRLWQEQKHSILLQNTYLMLLLPHPLPRRCSNLPTALWLELWSHLCLLLVFCDLLQERMNCFRAKLDTVAWWFILSHPQLSDPFWRSILIFLNMQYTVLTTFCLRYFMPCPYDSNKIKEMFQKNENELL